MGDRQTVREAAAAAEELLRRRRGRETLEGFTTYTYPQYEVDPFHAALMAAADRVVSGECKRLMVFAPPQCGKSEVFSVRLPAFWLGKRPDDPVILATYSGTLAESKSRQAREVVEDVAFQRLFPGVGTDPSSRSVQKWKLNGRRGGMLATGVGGPLTGNPAMLAIIDDPVANWNDARSPVLQEQTWEWYRTVFRTRVWEGGAIVLMMTRWHAEDLAGKILQDGAEEWEILRFPGLAETQAVRDKRNVALGLGEGLPDPLGREPGETVAPRRFSTKEMGIRYRSAGPMAAAALYDGYPEAAGGNLFQEEWFPIVDFVPHDERVVRRVRYWDLAGTLKGDWTVGVKMARTSSGRFYVEDVARVRMEPGARDAFVKRTAMLDGRGVEQRIEEEPGSAGKTTSAHFVRLLAGFIVSTIKPTGDKEETRPMPLAAQASNGNVLLVRGKWNGEYVNEMTAFPNGKWDDQVDASAGALERLTEGETGGVAQYGGVFKGRRTPVERRGRKTPFRYRVG